MHKDLPVAISIDLSEAEYEKFCSLIYSLCGISLGDNKKELVKARLMKRIRYYGFSSYEQYYQYVLEDKSGKEVEYMLNAISTNVTSFFREIQHFDYLAQKALPEIVEAKRRARENKLRIWSSASSTGEEVYTILMTVMEYLKSAAGWDIKVLGTDISSQALEIARQARYEAEKVRGIPRPLLEKYFVRDSRGPETFFRVKESLSQMAVFGRLNLMRETYPFQGKFDIIFCRNVMIYFDKATQESLVARLHRYLNDGGYLFIGHSESLIGTRVQFRTMCPACFRKEAGLALPKGAQAYQPR